MSNSDKLRQSHTDFGGGKRIFNEDALIHEVKLSSAVLDLQTELEALYPNTVFSHKSSISKLEISQKVNPEYIPENPNSSVKPDGGVLYMEHKGKQYPILISEAKKQGTNVLREQEGLKKQAKGNAIERAYKNIEEFKCYCSDIDYFPYVIFAYGCDFSKGSSILDRLDSMTKYKPRNYNYTLMKDQTTTIFVQPEYFTFKQIYDIIKEIAISIIKHIKDNY